MMKRVSLAKREKGFTLIEVLIALAIMAMVAVIFLMALSTSGKAVLLAQERTTAESIARSQMEYIKQQDYSDTDIDDGIYAEVVTSEHPTFTIWSINEDGDIIDNVVGVPWDTITNQKATTDEGLQKVTLVIKHGDKVVLTLEGYKVNR